MFGIVTGTLSNQMWCLNYECIVHTNIGVLCMKEIHNKAEIKFKKHAKM